MLRDRGQCSLHGRAAKLAGLALLVMALGAACTNGPIASPARSGLAGRPSVAAVTVHGPSACGEPDRVQDPGDINDDGLADFAVGEPSNGTGTTPTGGAVVVQLYGVGSQRVSESDLLPDGGAQNGDGFGSAVLVADLLRGDTCSDLAIGAPGRAGAGAVFLVPGGRVDRNQAAIAGGAQLIAGQSAGDRFGAALAANGTTLWVGAPGRPVDGRAGAGAVYEYSLASGRPVLVTTVTQATDGVDAQPETDDGFGSVLAANERGVLIGTPGDDIGPVRDRRDAGSVTFYPERSGSATAYRTSTWTQGSRGLTTRTQAGARFGAAVASDPAGTVLLAGAPGADLPTGEDAGLVQVFAADHDAYAPRDTITQDTPDVPGRAEPGDAFGTSVAVGRGIRCRGSTDGVVGSPGEDVDAFARQTDDAGSVTVVGLDDLACPARLLQGVADLHGGAEGIGASMDDLHGAQDHLGTAVTVLRHRAGERGERDSVLVSVPGLDIVGASVPDKYQSLAPVVDCGAVLVVTVRPRGSQFGTLGRLVLDGPVAGTRFGQVLSAAPG